ncbi:uncharacterized protein BJ171DRAFT_501702 [Polychytrium aggregatum]|uniref:uncharacterized protein n=1 Tax=Polychytrium aggregatum TaxID=110093 RepID=UPI0022FF082E|nr:uncharacterized protein BJ171DRAFT_501702 [Polychytrium aggregatum]KAI9205290.1 hypothetical protein BJ171DRAFT_501702 [Polychytrium aggregatum]
MSAAVLYKSARKQVEQLKLDLDKLLTGNDTSPGHMGAITSTLTTLKKTSDDLADMAKREITLEKRELAATRSQEIRTEYQNLKGQFDQFKQEYQKKREEEERTMLMGSEAASAVHQRGPTKFFQNGNNLAQLSLDEYMAQESGALNNVGNQLDGLINSGRAALQELYEQKSILKGTQRRMLDIANSLGLSTTLIRYIEQRTAVDNWILLAGIVVSVIIMWAVVHWLT